MTFQKKPPSTGASPSAPALPRAVFRRPTADDGAALWALAKDSGTLDLNSPYAYVMMAHWFSGTAILAEQPSPTGPQPVGFVIGFRPPADSETLFVWQVAVSSSCRGQGLARRMIQAMISAAPTAPVRFVEATVTPSNRPSAALFHSVANTAGVPIAVKPLFAAVTFPQETAHEGEDLYRLGPFPIPLTTDSPPA